MGAIKLKLVITTSQRYKMVADGSLQEMLEEAFSEHQPEDFDLKLDDDFVIATFMVPDDSTLEELQEVELPDIVVHIEITSLDD